MLTARRRKGSPWDRGGTARSPDAGFAGLLGSSRPAKMSNKIRVSPFWTDHLARLLTTGGGVQTCAATRHNRMRDGRLRDGGKRRQTKGKTRSQFALVR